MEITQLQATVQLSFKQSQENTDALEGKCYYLVALKKKTNGWLSTVMYIFMTRKLITLERGYECIIRLYTFHFYTRV